MVGVKVLVIVLFIIFFVFSVLIIDFLKLLKDKNKLISKLREDNISLCCDNIRLINRNNILEARLKRFERDK